jgi:hypothetical protein
VGPEHAAVDIDLLSASLRADLSDLNAFVESLAIKLEDAIPQLVRVERRRGGLLGPKLVRRIAVDAGEQRLELESRSGVVETSCSRMSGGIVLKRESIATGAWLGLLGEALSSEARRSETTRRALERLLTG